MRSLVVFLVVFGSFTFVCECNACAFIPLDSSLKLSVRDSIREHYLKHGAWTYLINSEEYGREIDSAIAFSHDDAYLWQQRRMPYIKQMKYEIAMAYIDSAVK